MMRQAALGDHRARDRFRLRVERDPKTPEYEHVDSAVGRPQYGIHELDVAADAALGADLLCDFKRHPLVHTAETSESPLDTERRSEREVILVHPAHPGLD